MQRLLMSPSNHITALNCGECTNGVHFFIASLPISLPGFLLIFSGLFQNFSMITDIMAAPIPNAKTMNAVKILSKEISLNEISLKLNCRSGIESASATHAVLHGFGPWPRWRAAKSFFRLPPLAGSQMFGWSFWMMEMGTSLLTSCGMASSADWPAASCSTSWTRRLWTLWSRGLLRQVYRSASRWESMPSDVWRKPWLRCVSRGIQHK